MKIKKVLLGILCAVMASCGRTAVFAESAKPHFFIGTQGELLTDGTPYVTVGLQNWPAKNYSVGINASTVSWKQDYPEYDFSPIYNNSRGRIYMLGGRIGRQLPWKIEFAENRKMDFYAGVEVNAIIARTTWHKGTFWQKAGLVGVQFFPKRNSSLSLIFEAGVSHEAGVKIDDNSSSANDNGYGLKPTYNIGCRWGFRRR